MKPATWNLTFRQAAIVLPLIRQILAAGAHTPRQGANALHARGIAATRAGKWYATGV